jgi:hypothetical protein
VAQHTSITTFDGAFHFQKRAAKSSIHHIYSSILTAVMGFG